MNLIGYVPRLGSSKFSRDERLRKRDKVRICRDRDSLAHRWNDGVNRGQVIKNENKTKTGTNDQKVSLYLLIFLRICSITKIMPLI